MADSAMTQLVDGKRARLKAENRQAILEAARGVFARTGYESTTVRDIIRETELAAGTFYNYFKSKEEVFQALASTSAAQFRPLLQQVRAKTNTFDAFIRGAFRAYFQFLSDENEEAIKMGAPHMVLIGVRVDTPEMQAVFEEIRSDVETMLNKQSALNVDAEYLAAAAIGIARDLGDHMLMRRPVDVDEATEFATMLLMSGIAGLVSKS